MPVTKCRVCGNVFFEKPLLKYENMPGAAQFLPNEETVKTEKGVDLEICQCSGCGLVQLSNAPVRYYRDVIRAAAFSEEMKGFRVKQFRDFIEKYSLPNKRIIEIGCGCGEYLTIMQKLGVEAYGLEHLGNSVRQCVKNGLKVSEGFIENENLKLDNSPFDAFYILNFLEHLPDINTALRGIANNLTNDAVGLVEVPNFDMVLQDKLFSEFISDHLFYFTRDTLSTCLQINGFEIIECKEVWYDYILSAVIRKRQVLDITDFYNSQEKLKSEIEAFIVRFEPGKVAVWGAGHQALAVIALTGLADKIKYVVDSAVFKQGKYTPATHLPIVAPDNLEKDPVDALIIMAAGYSDEIAKIIKNKYQNKINAVILRSSSLETV
ncbi:MAG: methyltransferase domain-containing protein [Victivallaceae bacterium]|nr:methyltransferase domain-containing protein [Victivallaceae bacterium]